MSPEFDMKINVEKDKGRKDVKNLLYNRRLLS